MTFTLTLQNIGTNVSQQNAYSIAYQYEAVTLNNFDGYEPSTVEAVLAARAQPAQDIPSDTKGYMAWFER